MIAVVLLAAAATFVDSTGHLSPAAFDFVKPGVTRAEVDKRLGAPFISSESVVTKGQIDLFVDEPPTQESSRAPVETEDVHFYEYRPEKFPLEFVRIVFRGDAVWYAQLPPQSSERTKKDLLGRYGADSFKLTNVERGPAHLRRTVTIYRIPQKGIAFVASGNTVTHRVVFPPER